MDCTRINLVDRAWSGHWMIGAVHPVKVPSADDVRRDLADLLLTHPKHPLLAALDDDRHWHHVAPGDRDAHLRRIVQETDRPGDDLERVAEDFAAGGGDTATRILLGPDYLVVHVSHMAADGTGIDALLQAVLTRDYSELLPYARHVGVPAMIAPLLFDLYTHAISWLRFGKARRSAEQPEPTMAANWQQLPASTTIVTHRLHAPAMDQIRQLRRREHPDASLNSLLITLSWQALRAEGLPLKASGYHGVFDLRQFLPKRLRNRGGALAKTLWVPTDMTDATAIDRAIKEATASCRVLPATVLGALAQLRGGHPAEPEPGAEVSMTLAHSAIPQRPRWVNLPYTDPVSARLIGYGYPVQPTGITIFTMRMETSTEVVACFDQRTVSASQVQRALERLDDLEFQVSDVAAS